MLKPDDFKLSVMTNLGFKWTMLDLKSAQDDALKRINESRRNDNKDTYDEWQPGLSVNHEGSLTVKRTGKDKKTKESLPEVTLQLKTSAAGLKHGVSRGVSSALMQVYMGLAKAVAKAVYQYGKMQKEKAGEKYTNKEKKLKQAGIANVEKLVTVVKLYKQAKKKDGKNATITTSSTLDECAKAAGTVIDKQTSYKNLIEMKTKTVDDLVTDVGMKTLGTLISLDTKRTYAVCDKHGWYSAVMDQAMSVNQESELYKVFLTFQSDKKGLDKTRSIVEMLEDAMDAKSKDFGKEYLFGKGWVNPARKNVKADKIEEANKCIGVPTTLPKVKAFFMQEFVNMGLDKAVAKKMTRYGFSHGKLAFLTLYKELEARLTASLTSAGTIDAKSATSAFLKDAAKTDAFVQNTLKSVDVNLVGLDIDDSIADELTSKDVSQLAKGVPRKRRRKKKEAKEDSPTPHKKQKGARKKNKNNQP